MQGNVVRLRNNIDMSFSPAAETTLITGGTNIWSPAGTVVVNVSGKECAILRIHGLLTRCFLCRRSIGPAEPSAYLTTTTERECPCVDAAPALLISLTLKPTTSYIEEHYETGCDLYRRLMGLKKKGRHALWIPHLNISLSLERRQQGVRIGDVGIITPNGAFDFMFSIYSPPTGSSDPSSLPSGFEQMQTPSSLEREVVVISEHSAHDALTSIGIAKQAL